MVEDPSGGDAARTDGHEGADGAAAPPRDETASTASGPPDCDCKLGRSARRFGLDGLAADLQRRHADGASLRDLERVVNEAILQRALEDADAAVVGDAGALYETLHGEDGTAGERTELRRHLSSAGIDVDAVESAFVSYQTVRTHLRECLDVDTDRESPLSRSDAEGTIEWARARSEGIVERTLERLARSDAIAAGDLEATSVVRVRCTDCGASGTVESFLERGGCDCDHADD